jgi:pimeloyl-ACP methyl ester carboxylesterase
MANQIEEYIETVHGKFLVRSIRGVAASDRIIMVHGLWASSFLWDDVADILAAQGVFPISVDLLGHGRSDKPNCLATIPDHGSSILALADSLDWNDVTLVGNSMGSLVAVAAAARRPHRVPRLITFGCPAWASERERLEWLHDRTGYIDMQTGMPQPRQPLNESPTALALAQNYNRIGIWILNSMWSIYAYDLMTDLSRIDTDFHAFYGESDFLLDTARNLQCAGVQLGTIPAAGHNAPLENAGGVAQALIQILCSTTKGIRS